ncbi:unnamed protein product [Candida verbasci]|uniref:Temperature shock-inducible protein 1 n=1 Tax=Candida verbasci TaxID=1227364 RepID=A0A9W4TRU5_9ASCO|nr:unnamed protein product [Candida verbasci]
MKFSKITGALMTTIGLVSAANEQDVAFLTALVNDFQSHRADYLRFLQTATGVPSQLETFATKVITYQDDSYTTLLDNSDFDVTTLENFATGLPWYTRIEANAGGAASGSSNSDSSNSNSASSSAAATSSSAASSAGAAGGGNSLASSTTDSQTTSQTSNDSLAIATGSVNAANIIGKTGMVAAPIGAVMGALAIALM